MVDSIGQAIRRLAGNRCEYCHLPDEPADLKHVLDHIIARQHGGLTVVENLALCCGRCNLYKGPNIAGIDPETGSLTPLFHPRDDRWDDHFRWDGAIMVAKTPIGRVTIAVLSINQTMRVSVRKAFMDEGRF